MEISFSTNGDIQVVTIKGALGEPEAAAVRFKLEAKINQGRMKVLFDASAYTITDNAARGNLLGIILYSINRNTLTVCCGVPTEHWPLMILQGGKQVKLLISINEGIDYLSKTPLPGDQKKAELGKKLGGKAGEDEIKQSALSELLRKYEIFQQNDSDDPFRLDFHISQYKTAPSHETLAVERKAKESFSKVIEEIGALNKECDDLALKVKSYMQIRKQPLTAKELELKQKTLTNDLAEQQQILAGLKKEIAENVQARDEASSIGQDTQKQMGKELLDLEKKIQDTTVENDKIAKDLQAKDAEEQKQLDKLKSGQPAP
jgi:hypothetical protein